MTADSPSQKSVINALLDLRNDLAGRKTFGQYLRAKSRDGRRLFETQAEALGDWSSPIYGALIQDFEESALKQGAEQAAIHYSQMRAIHKWHRTIQQDSLWRSFWKKAHKADKSPEVEVGNLMASWDKVIKSRDPKAVEEFQTILGAIPNGPISATKEGKHAWSVFQQMGLDMILLESQQQIGADLVLSGPKLARQLKSIGPEKLNQMFGPEASEKMLALGELLSIRTVQDQLVKNFSKSGHVLVKEGRKQNEGFVAFVKNPLGWLNNRRVKQRDRKGAVRLLRRSGEKGIPAGRQYF